MSYRSVLHLPIPETPAREPPTVDLQHTLMQGLKVHILILPCERNYGEDVDLIAILIPIEVVGEIR